MHLSRLSIPDTADTSLTFRFPGAAASGGGSAGGDASADAGASARTNDGKDGVDRAGQPLALLTLRSAGDMRHVAGGMSRTRSAFFQGAGVEPARVLGVKLAHSHAILLPADREEHELLATEALELRGGADGIITCNGDLVPMITAADCMPIWLLDRSSGAFGVLHSGWRGTGILGEAVTLLAARYGSSPSAMAVILGPAIGSCCYDVPEGRALQFLKDYGPRAAFRRDATWRIDLREANLVLAERAGIGFALSVDACTFCDTRLGSYRREGPAAFTCMAAACGRFSKTTGGES